MHFLDSGSTKGDSTWINFFSLTERGCERSSIHYLTRRLTSFITTIFQKQWLSELLTIPGDALLEPFGSNTANVHLPPDRYECYLGNGISKENIYVIPAKPLGISLSKSMSCLFCCLFTQFYQKIIFIVKNFGQTRLVIKKRIKK